MRPAEQLTYPADLLRRRMQMVGLKDQALGYQYNGAWDGAFRSSLTLHSGRRKECEQHVTVACASAPARL